MAKGRNAQSFFENAFYTNEQTDTLLLILQYSLSQNPVWILKIESLVINFGIISIEGLTLDMICCQSLVWLGAGKLRTDCWSQWPI